MTISTVLRVFEFAALSFVIIVLAVVAGITIIHLGRLLLIAWDCRLTAYARSVAKTDDAYDYPRVWYRDYRWCLGEPERASVEKHLLFMLEHPQDSRVNRKMAQDLIATHLLHRDLGWEEVPPATRTRLVREAAVASSDLPAYACWDVENVGNANTVKVFLGAPGNPGLPQEDIAWATSPPGTRSFEDTLALTGFEQLEHEVRLHENDPVRVRPANPLRPRPMDYPSPEKSGLR